METKEYKGIEYAKDFHSLTDNVVSVLADGEFPTVNIPKWDRFNKDLMCDRVLGVIQFPFIDIELEMWTKQGNNYDEATEDDKDIKLSYVVCRRFGYGEDDWDTDGWVDKDVMVDWSDADWEIQLEEDMLSALEKYAEERGLSYTEPIER